MLKKPLVKLKELDIGFSILVPPFRLNFRATSFFQKREC